jgi:hypothetical protein
MNIRRYDAVHHDAQQLLPIETHNSNLLANQPGSTESSPKVCIDPRIVVAFCYSFLRLLKWLGTADGLYSCCFQVTSGSQPVKPLGDVLLPRNFSLFQAIGSGIYSPKPVSSHTHTSDLSFN